VERVAIIRAVLGGEVRKMKEVLNKDQWLKYT
jgi:hypothetical protein